MDTGFSKSDATVADHLCVKIDFLKLVPLRDWLKGREKHEVVAQWVGSDAGSRCKLSLLDETEMLADPRNKDSEIGIPSDNTYSVETLWLTQPELRKLDRALGRCGREFTWLENTVK